MMMCYGAANRDPEVFDRPDEFRLDRPTSELRRHLAFGTGPHLCVGAALARLEMRVALSRLMERFPELHPTGQPTRIETYLLWGRRTQPVAPGPV
jgi:cytochrome P450